MQSSRSKALMASVLFGICVVANAGTRVDEVWRCQLNDGKTLKDVHAANGKWLKFVNTNVEGGDIHSYVATSIVGDTTHFLYIDSFPNMKAWIDTKALLQKEEGLAIEAELNEIATCSSNSLHSTTETEMN